MTQTSPGEAQNRAPTRRRLRFGLRVAGLALLALLPLAMGATIPAQAASPPTVQISPVNANSDRIDLTFATAIPAGDIVDVEVYSGTTRVWQYTSTSGGTSFSATTPSLASGSFAVSIGLFTPNWANNYAWYDRVKTFSLPNSAGGGTSTNPSVSVSSASSSTEKINVTFSQSVPAGNIMDIAVYKGAQSGQAAVWQYTSTAGGTSFSATTASLPAASYTVSIGLFTPNWASNYAWYSGLATFSIGGSGPVSTATSTPTRTATASPTRTATATATRTKTPTATVTRTPTKTPTPNSSVSPTSTSTATKTATATATATKTATVGPSPTPSSDLTAQALSAYQQWKSTYVVSVSPGVARVVRDWSLNDTVSEGMGYGMLASMAANDRTTFDSLWKYVQLHLDAKGLMDWNIGPNGNITGSGAATDADEDIAYALMKASARWPGFGYDTAATNMINAILTYEVRANNLVGPGDSWTSQTVINPSYLAPHYYRAFATFTGNTRWSTIAGANSAWLLSASNPTTGLLPDWLNHDFTSASEITWDSNKNSFYYDASRAPIRLLLAHRLDADSNAQTILSREAAFLGGIGMANLKSGYTLQGAPLTNYLDLTFISAYAAAGQVNPTSPFGQASLNALVTATPTEYFGASLRVLVLLMLTQPF